MTEKNTAARALSARLCEIVDNMTVPPERRLSANARRLDAEIATLVWGPPGNGWEDAPRFTTSLDAALPGETIVRIHLLRSGGYWETEAADERGDWHYALAATEALGRRAAALLAWGVTRK